MESSSTKKIEYWREQVNCAESHALGVTVYLREKDIRPSTYYGWRKYLQVSGMIQNGNTASKKPKRPRSPFLPVTVAVPTVAPATQDFQRELPDPRWVAQVMLHLVRGER